MSVVLGVLSYEQHQIDGLKARLAVKKIAAVNDVRRQLQFYHQYVVLIDSLAYLDRIQLDSLTISAKSADMVGHARHMKVVESYLKHLEHAPSSWSLKQSVLNIHWGKQHDIG